MLVANELELDSVTLAEVALVPVLAEDCIVLVEDSLEDVLDASVIVEGLVELETIVLELLELLELVTLTA